MASAVRWIAFPGPLPTSLLASRLMLQAGLDNKAAAALPPKPPRPRGKRRQGEIRAPAGLGGEPVGPKQIRPVCLI